MAEGTLHAVGPSAAGAAGGHCSDDVGYSASEDDYSTVTPGSDTESSWSLSDSQILAHGTDLGMPPVSDTSTSPQRTSFTISNPTSDSTSSSDSSNSEAVARRREEQTIPHELPKLVARLLRSKKVREKIAPRLRKHGTSFKVDQAQFNIIHVKPALKLDKVQSVLENDILKAMFRVQEGDLDDRGIIESLNSKELQDQMVMEYENGTLSIVYHKSIGDNISTYLEMLKNPQKQLSLSFKPARYLARHMQWFDKTFHTRLTRYQVKMSLAGGLNNAPCLVVTCRKPYSRDAFSKVEEHIACLGQSDVEVSLATGLYLQSRHGERVLKETEEKHHCVLDVETPVQQVLLRASSSNHQLLVCEGNMVATDCHVIIVPLCGGQKEWPPLYKHIMDRECLSDEAHRFLSKVGPDMWVYSTRCTGSTSKRHIIVMFVPSLSNDEEFQRLLQTSCKAAMDLAIYDNPQTDIALPLKLGDHLPLKTCVMPMLMAVVESIQGNLCPDDAVHVKLYLDKLSPDTTQLLATMENRLPLCGWSLNTFFGNIDGGQISRRKQHLRDKALVRVFGLKEDAEKASSKVTNIEAPHDYKERVEHFKSLELLLDASSKGASRSTVPKSNTTTPVSSDKKIRIVETDHDTLKSVMDIAIDRSAMDQWSSQPAAAASPGNRPSRPKDPCVICTEEPIAPKSLSCGHTFCTECIDKWLKTRAICPTCNKSQGVHCGNQEVGGTMKMTYSRYCVHGFEFTGSYIIFYSFLSGKQTDEHPFPGQQYSDIQRTAYLPDTREGRTVLMLLKVAFDRRLIFTVGQSATTGEVGITWNDIRHKTNRSGGPACHGYPDPGYLMRVKQDLADKGVTEKDFTPTQRDFIQNPDKYCDSSDFSKHFGS